MELKPGREMDAKVAEFLGWRKSRINPDTLWFHPDYGCMKLPPFSTDDGVAFTQVYSWLETNCKSLRMESGPESHRSLTVFAEEDDWEEFFGDKWAVIICRGALWLKEALNGSPVQ